MPGPDDPSAAPNSRSLLAGAGIVGLLAALWFASGLSSEPAFADEWAYLSQTYYADLWLAGDRDAPAWLAYPAYDLPPLPKYAYGLALRVTGFRRPGPEAARRWYLDTHSKCGPPAMLDAARWPAVAFGAVGCVCIYGLGTLCGGRRVGLVAALLLMVNPLYRLHARRAMSDVIAESLILLATLAFLWTWRRMLGGSSLISPWIGATAAGVAAGLAALAKLNGALAMIIIAAWVLLALALPRVSPGRKLAVAGAAVLAGFLSLATFVALNPFVTAKPRGTSAATTETAPLSPLERLRYLVKHRVAVSTDQQRIPIFKRDALTTPQDKLATVVVQGFGRFGPFGPRHSNSEVRYERSQDRGAIVWLPLVLAGAASCLVQGRNQLDRGDPPVAWAILLQAAVSLVVVSAYLPLAWDRYFLSLQPGSALLAATALVAVGDSLRQTLGHRTAKV